MMAIYENYQDADLYAGDGVQNGDPQWTSAPPKHYHKQLYDQTSMR